MWSRKTTGSTGISGRLGKTNPVVTPDSFRVLLDGTTNWPAVMEALADPAVRERLAQLGQEIPPPDRQTPETLGAYQKAEIEKWWPIIKAANIKGE